MLDGRKHAVGHQYLPGAGVGTQAGSEIVTLPMAA